MVEGKWYAQGADIAVPLQVRAEALGAGRDALDNLARQVAVFQGGRAVGAARLWWEDGAFHAGEICVLPAERGKGYGDLLVRLLKYKAVSHGAATLTVRCPRALLPFFERYGFAAQGEGEPLTLVCRLNEGCEGCGGCGAGGGCGQS